MKKKRMHFTQVDVCRRLLSVNKPHNVIGILATLLLWQASCWADSSELTLFSSISEPLTQYQLSTLADDTKSNFAPSSVLGRLADNLSLDGKNQQIRRLFRDPRFGDVRIAAFSFKNLLDAGLMDEKANVTLSDDGPLRGAPLRDIEVGPGADGWQTLSAKIGTEHPGGLALIVEEDGATGAIQYRGQTYQVRKLTGDLHALSTPRPEDVGRMFDNDVDQSDDGAANAGHTEDADVDSSCATPPDETATIDLVIAYTPRAKSEAIEMTVNIDTQIRVATLVSNVAFKNSGIRARFNVLEVFEVDYAESGEPRYFRDDMKRIKTGSRNLRELHTARERTRADVAILVAHDDDPRRCGIAGAIDSDIDEAFAVVNWQCLTNKFSFAHEIGHLAGARHDNDSNLPLHAHGYFVSQDDPELRFGTIMATQTSCGAAGCGRIWHWSNPAVQYERVPTGTREKNNNACIWNSNARKIASFGGGS